MVKTQPMSTYHLNWSNLKPLHGSWIVDLHNQMQRESESIVKWFKEAGIVEAINPFDTSVLVCPSQVKYFEKKLFSEIFMKSSLEPNFEYGEFKNRTHFPKYFIFISIFASIRQKYRTRWVKKIFYCHIT